jgi:hypothetical protein
MRMSGKMGKKERKFENEKRGMRNDEKTRKRV